MGVQWHTFLLLRAALPLQPNFSSGVASPERHCATCGVRNAGRRRKRKVVAFLAD